MTRISILFVCLGNICRSPMAETIFNHILEKNGKTVEYHTDSAGLIGYHEGEKADTRMRQHAEKRGYHISHRSRPVTPEDMERFDYIVGMDEQNINQLNRLAKTDEARQKIHKMTEYNRKMVANNIPDPYYGGDKGFENVINLLEDACQGLFNMINK
ncbi:MAG: low molecular weight protein-tyrosine-phosphatase [Paludibacteraceae bacterium]